MKDFKVEFYDQSDALLGTIEFPKTDVNQGGWVPSGSGLLEPLYGTPNVAPMGYHSTAAVSNPGNLSAPRLVRFGASLTF